MGFRDRPLAREIAVVLVLKVAAIAVIWGVFFGPDTRAVVDKPALASHILPAAVPSALPQPTPDAKR